MSGDHSKEKYSTTTVEVEFPEDQKIPWTVQLEFDAKGAVTGVFDRAGNQLANKNVDHTAIPRGNVCPLGYNHIIVGGVHYCIPK